MYIHTSIHTNCTKNTQIVHISTNQDECNITHVYTLSTYILSCTWMCPSTPVAIEALW